MEAMKFPAIATNTPVAWSVMNGTGSATIDANGLLTAMSNGVVTVIGSTNDTCGISDSMAIDISGQNASIDNLIAANQQINLYPNPATQFVTIEAEGRIEQVEIYSIAGQLIQAHKQPGNRISVKELISGTYLVRVLSDDSWKTVRMVKE